MQGCSLSLETFFEHLVTSRLSLETLTPQSRRVLFTCLALRVILNGKCCDVRRCCDVAGVDVMIERRRMKFVEKLFADEQLSFLSKVRWC